MLHEGGVDVGAKDGHDEEDENEERKHTEEGTAFASLDPQRLGKEVTHCLLRGRASG
jgi:hypothetical protein